jgi:WXG100 family type VII secretion target
MADDLTYVQFGGMETGAQNFGRVAKALETELNDLNAKVQQHFADWEGGAKQAYTEAQQMWRSTADSMNALVVQLQNVIQTGHENYSNAESTNTKIWG